MAKKKKKMSLILAHLAQIWPLKIFFRGFYL